jgi:hypothetical protein
VKPNIVNVFDGVEHVPTNVPVKVAKTKDPEKIMLRSKNKDAIA